MNETPELSEVEAVKVTAFGLDRKPRPLDSRPYRNRLDGTRWPDNGGDPELLWFKPRRDYEQDQSEYPLQEAY